MACFQSFGSAIAWYCGDVPELKELQANFQRIRFRLKGNIQPYRFKTQEAIFEVLAPYYKSKDVLLKQLSMAQQAYDAGMMNYAKSKTSGCLKKVDQVTYEIRSDKSEQLNLPGVYVPKWYWQHWSYHGLPIPDGVA